MLPKWPVATLLLAAQALIFGCQIWLVTQVFLHCDRRYLVVGNVACAYSSLSLPSD